MVFVLAILACAYVCLFFNLGSYSLKEPDEGRYAEIPREMIEQGDYLVPHLNYVRYFEKPPLLYWLIAGSYKVFGVSEWSFRFPNALVALLSVLTTFFFVSRWFPARVAIISSVILMTSFGFFALARIVTTDMLFAFLLFASLSCFYEFYRTKNKPFLFLFYVNLALAVLTKGPVAVILLGVTISLFLIIEKQWSFMRKMLSFKGLLVFVAIAVPWFVLICIREREFFRFFFIDQNILRFLTTRHNRSGPIYYFLPVLFGGLFPWSIFIPRAVIRFRRAPGARLFFLWSLVVFVFFSLSGSKLPTYILPIFPTLAVPIAALFRSGWNERIQQDRELIVYMVFFLCLTIGGLVFGLGFFGAHLKHAPLLSRDMIVLAFAFSTFSFAILVLFAFGRVRTFGSLFHVLTTFSLSVIIFLMLRVQVIDYFNTTKELAETVNRSGKSAVVLSFRSFHETLPFYLGRRIYLVERTGELEMGAKYVEARQFFIGKDKFVKLFQSDKPVFVVAKTKHLSFVKEPGFEDATVLKCRDTRCLIANGPAARLNKPGGDS